MTGRTTPAQAWEGFVGSQTPQEFHELNVQQGIIDIDEMCTRYVAEVPSMFQMSTDERRALPDDLADLLAKYIRQALANA
jgi:hypothetical protein